MLCVPISHANNVDNQFSWKGNISLDVQNHFLWKLLSLVKNFQLNSQSSTTYCPYTTVLTFSAIWKINDNAISIQKCKVLIIKYVNVEETNKDQICTDVCYCRLSKCCNRVKEASHFNATSSKEQITLYKNYHSLLNSIRIALWWKWVFLKSSEAC